MFAAALTIPAAAALMMVPHRLDLTRVAPMSAVTVWVSALALRAGLTISAALAVLVLAPQSGSFQDLAQACWHAAGIDLSGHPLADAATALPAIALGASLVWLAVELIRSAAALRGYLRRHGRGRGPLGTTLVAEPEVLLAASTIGRARVLVSDGAVARLDREELAAALAHEFGHLQRWHRPLLTLGRALAALSRPLPGSRVAERQLHLSLERDADEYAVARTHDALSLASAICKAAGGAVPYGVAALGGGHVGVRLEQLVEHEGRRRSGERFERSARVLAALMAATTLALVTFVPAWAIGSAVSVRAAHVAAVAPH